MSTFARQKRCLTGLTLTSGQTSMHSVNLERSWDDRGAASNPKALFSGANRPAGPNHSATAALLGANSFLFPGIKLWPVRSPPQGTEQTQKRKTEKARSMDINHKLMALGVAFSLLGTTSAFARPTPHYANACRSYELRTDTGHVPTTEQSGATGCHPSASAVKDDWPAEMILG